MIGDTYIDPKTGAEKLFIKPKAFSVAGAFDEGDEEKLEREVSEETVQETLDAVKEYRKKIGLR